MKEYRKAGFEIIDGYYYNESRNNTVNHVIKDWYDLRKKLKEYKDPAQMVKLLMNSMYGKTIIKPVETDTIVKDNRDDFGKCTSYNYNYNDSVIEVKLMIFLFILRRLNQSYIILIMSIVVLRF